MMNDAGLEWQNEFRFDKDGNLIEVDGEEFACDRDDSGRIVSLTLEEAVEDDEETFTAIDMELTYDSNGHVAKVISTSEDESWAQNYRYDKDGNLRERDYDAGTDDELLTYEYKSFDRFGNWTLRLEKLGSMDQTITQQRKITYDDNTDDVQK